jgi:hypothetical protein
MLKETMIRVIGVIGVVIIVNVKEDKTHAGSCWSIDGRRYLVRAENREKVSVSSQCCNRTLM